MTLKLQLVRDGKIVLEVPLSPMDWTKDQMNIEFEAFEDDFEKFSPEAKKKYFEIKTVKADKKSDKTENQ